MTNTFTTTVVSDAPWYMRSQIWFGAISLLTFIALQFPEWDRWIKVTIQILQFGVTAFGIDRKTRSVLPSDLPRDVQFVERDGTTEAPKQTFGGEPSK